MGELSIVQKIKVKLINGESQAYFIAMIFLIVIDSYNCYLLPNVFF